MLTVVPTPIGNLRDITLRALDALRDADLIAAEDTRHTGILLKAHAIEGRMISFHEHNEARRTAELIERLRAGLRLALVSDAGTPGLSDPGVRLVRAVIEEQLPYTVLPGASAAITGLIGSGFAASEFTFCGFLPNKSGRRERMITEASERRSTTIWYESPHRLLRSLEVLARIAPDRQVCVARELTKVHEEFRIGPASALLEHYTARPPKGEICLLLDAPPGKREGSPRPSGRE